MRLASIARPALTAYLQQEAMWLSGTETHWRDRDLKSDGYEEEPAWSHVVAGNFDLANQTGMTLCSCKAAVPTTPYEPLHPAESHDLPCQ